MQGSDVATDALVDRQLVRQLCAGDAVALEAIYRRHSRLVFTLIVRILRDRHEAEDVLEDVFFELWRSADRFDESRGTVRAFLVTLARSRAIDRLRKRDGSTGTRPIVRTVGDDTPERANEPQDDPAMRADLEERRSQVAKALGELEPGTRELIERSFYEGQSHTEIAESLGKPLGSVKTQIRRGLQTMAKVLKTVQSILI